MTRTGTAALLDAADLEKTPWPPARWLAQHPRIADWIVVLACTGLQRVALLFAGNPDNWTAYIALGVTSLALLWRRRYPFAVLTAVVIASTASALLHPDLGVQTLPFAFALYTVSSRQRISRAVLGYGLGVGIPLVGALALLLTTGSAFSPTVLEPYALVALLLGLIVRNRQQRREAITELVNERIENARAAERARITAEMHDVVAHSLSVMIALADGASTGWQKHPERSARALENLSTVGRTALLDMQRILQLLRDADTALDEALHTSGHNIPTLENLTEVFRSAGLPVTLARSGTPIPDDPALTMTVYRIVQEALTNALRYATGATLVTAMIDHHDELIEITVTDDGRGTPHTGTNLGTGRGLIGIGQRAATYLGNSEAGPLSAGGWQTRATLRLPRPSGSIP